MALNKTVFRGLTFNVLVEEFIDRDARGNLNGYFASVYIEDKTSAAWHLVRRSRLPGAAKALQREIERDGIRAFRRLTLI